MKKLFMLLVCGLLLCASGCALTTPTDETPSPGLPVIEVAPTDVDAKLAELSEGAQGEAELFGYPIRPSYLADLNGDGEYELCMNLSFGSGICNDLVQCYYPATGQTSMLNERMITDYYATEYEGELYIIAHPYTRENAAIACRAVLTEGKLACEDIDPELQEAVLAAQG